MRLMVVSVTIMGSLIVGGLLCGAVGGSSLWYSDKVAQEREFYSLIARVRTIGLERDKKHAAWLMELLKHPPNFTFKYPIGTVPDGGQLGTPVWHLKLAILVALGRLGDSQVVSELEAQRYALRQVGLEGQLDVTIARIQAEASIPHPRSLSECQQKINLFLQGIGYNYDTWQSKLRTQSPELKAILAMRQAVEMACNAYTDGILEALLAINHLPLQRDYPSALRVRLCQLTPEARSAWLFEALKLRPIFNTEAFYEIQAFADCGAVSWNYLLKQLHLRLADPTWKPVQEYRLWHYILLSFTDSQIAGVLVQMGRHPSQEVQQLAGDIKRRFGGSPMVFASDW